ANGYPVGGLAGRRDLMEHFNGRTGDVLLAGTSNGNPLGCAAALATLDHLAEHPDFYTRTFDFGEQMRTGLAKIVNDLGLEAHAAALGGVFNLYFTPRPPRGYRDLLENDNEAYAAFHRSMIDLGHLMLPIPLKRNHISGAHTQADIDRTLEAAQAALSALAARAD